MSYEDQCVATVQDIHSNLFRRCENRSEAADSNYVKLIPICSVHYERARRQFAARIEHELEVLKREAASHECEAEKAVQQYVNESYEYRDTVRKRRLARSMAYFIYCGGYIKIGAGQSPVGRLNTIRHSGGVLAPRGLDLSTAELLATEHGGFGREAELHKKFSHLRDTGEWFRDSPELRTYIAGLADSHMKESA